jgi:hypothetical protein
MVRLQKWDAWASQRLRKKGDWVQRLQKRDASPQLLQKTNDRV